MDGVRTVDGMLRCDFGAVEAFFPDGGNTSVIEVETRAWLLSLTLAFDANVILRVWLNAEKPLWLLEIYALEHVMRPDGRS